MDTYDCLDYQVRENAAGNTEVWDSDNHLFTIGGVVTPDIVKVGIHAYLRGVSAGRDKGRHELRWEIRRILGIDG